MKAHAPTVPARYLVLLVDYLESIGLKRRDILQHAGIDEFRFYQFNASITAPEVDALLAAGKNLSARIDLGIDFGLRIQLNAHDILGYAVLSCQNPDQVFRLVTRYYRLITPMFVMSYRRHAKHAEIQVRPALPMSEETLHFYLEVISVSIHLQLKSVLQERLAGYDIHLSMACPAHAARYRELVPARFHFGDARLPGIRILIDSAQMDLPLGMADHRALAMAEERCKVMLQTVNEQGSWSDWVAMMLRESEDCQPTLAELAGILNIAPRTLDRYLSRESNNFRSISQNVRHQRACKLLRGGELPISQIAYKLGYSDAGNFSRAFSRIAGYSPTDFVNDGTVAAGQT